MRRLFALLAAASLLAACDSGSPAPSTPVTPPGPRGVSFRFAGLPASITVDVPDTRTVSLAAYRGGTLPQGFTATPELVGDAASILAMGHVSMSVRALREGTSTLRLRVAAPGYRDTTLTLTLVARVLCPPARPAGTQDAFPPVATAHFRYVSHYRSSRTNEASDGEGTLTLEPDGEPTCYRGTRSTPLAYHYEGTSGRPGTTPSPVAQQATAVAVEDSTNQVALPVWSPFDAGLRTVTFARFAPEGDRVVTEPAYQTCQRRVRLTADVGLVEDGVPYYCYLGFGVSLDWSLTRIVGRPASVGVGRPDA